MTSIYLVMTDCRTWGKGVDKITAVTNSVQGTNKIRQGEFYRFDFPDGWTDSEGQELIDWTSALQMINVNGIGAVSYPKGVEVKNLGIHSLVGIVPKILSINAKLAKIDEVE